MIMRLCSGTHDDRQLNNSRGERDGRMFVVARDVSVYRPTAGEER